MFVSLLRILNLNHGMPLAKPDLGKVTICPYGEFC